VAVAAAAVGIALLADDPDSADSPAQPVVQRDNPATTTEQPSEGEENGSPRDRGERSDATRRANDEKANGRAGSSGKRRPRTDEEPPSCPKVLSDSQCAAFAEAMESAGVGTAFRGGQCPPGLSSDQCEAIADVFEGADPGAPLKEGECPPGLTREQCATLR
jgi:hypothetical protein